MLVKWTINIKARPCLSPEDMRGFTVFTDGAFMEKSTGTLLVTEYSEIGLNERLKDREERLPRKAEIRAKLEIQIL